MPKKISDALTDRKARGNLADGRHADGRGLYLHVRGGARSWLFLWTPPGGKRREIGLGSLASLTLAQARLKAQQCRDAVASGFDPRVVLKGEDEVPTFKQAADALIEAKAAGWRNDKHKAQWVMTLGTYAKRLHRIKVDEITTADVLAVLKPHWQARPETARRLQGRIAAVIDAACAKHHIDRANPARWQGHLSHLLAAPQRLSRGHHAALAIDDVPGFIARLLDRQESSIAARALEFTILTAARTGEVIGAIWDEVDLDKGIWTVPAARMKAGRPHRVPLVPRAIEVLRSTESLSSEAGGFLFPGARLGKPLSQMAMAMQLRAMGHGDVTVHGFRSAFRDWCSERTGFSREIAEAALAHVVGDKVEAAYRRSDLFERRRELMAAWAAFCEPGQVGNVIAIGRANGSAL